MTDTSDTKVTHRRRLTLVWLAITGLILSLVVAAPVFAGHDGPLVTPTSPPGNENLDCDDLVTLGIIADYDFEDKSGSSPSGNVDLVHSSINVTDDEVSFTADAGWLVIAVNVKGGNEGSNIYDYEPLGGVNHDNGLITPTNQGVSHVTLCLITAPPTPTPSPTPTPTPTPEGSVGGGTGTPPASVPDTATSMPGFGGPLATLIFGAILVASLGTLAYANVRAAKQRQ